MPITNENHEVVLFLITFHKFLRKETFVDMDNQANEESLADQISQTESSYPKRKHRGRQVLFNLTRQFKSRRKKIGQLDKFQEAVSGQQAVPEYKVEVQKRGKGIILHYGFVKVLWDWLIMLCTFYIAIMVPFNAAFIVGEFDRTSIYADVAVEIIFGIDIVLNFRTTYVSNTGQVVYDSKLIALNYIRQWFLMDLLAAIPFDLLYAFQVETGTLIPLLKVARLLRLIRLFQKMDRYSQYASVVIILLLSMFALTAHWLACIWYSLGKFEVQNNPKSWKVGWLYDLSEVLENPIVNRTNIPEMWDCYLTALYFTCSSLTTVGFGNVSASTNAEKIFSICVMLLGSMMYALVFGNVTAIVQRAYARRATFHMKSNDLKDFYHTYNIPKPLKHRIQEYFQSMWTMNNGINFNELFSEFPEEMRGEISMHLYKEILSLPLFEGVNQGCLKAISLQIRRSFCVPGEYLIHRGDAVSYLYFILSGSLEILKDDKVIALLGKGDLFGIDLQYDEPVLPSSFSVKSLTYCELQGINTLGFINVLSLYPTVAEVLSESVQRELTFNLKDGEDTGLTDEPGARDATNLADYKRSNIPSYLLSESESNSQGENKDNEQNSTQPVNFQKIVKKVTKQKTIQDTLKRKIQMRKRGRVKEGPQKNEPYIHNTESMQTDINSLSKDINCIRQELRATIELLCNLTKVSKDTVIFPIEEEKPLASATNVESHMDSGKEEVTSDFLKPQIHKFTISTRDLEDITSETGVSDVTPDDNITDTCISEDYSGKESIECKNVDPLIDSNSKMEEGEYTESSDFKESPSANKSPHISVIFEPNVVKRKCPANSSADILQNAGKLDSQDSSVSGPSASSLNSPFGLTDFQSTEEDSPKTHIITETTHV